MGLTVNFQRPNVREVTAPKAPISSDQIESLGKGIGSYYRWNERQKAADMMEGKAKAQARIAEIDMEIADLEGQLQKISQGQQAYTDAQAQQRQQEAQNMSQAYGNAYAAQQAQVPQHPNMGYNWRR